LFTLLQVSMICFLYKLFIPLAVSLKVKLQLPYDLTTSKYSPVRTEYMYLYKNFFSGGWYQWEGGGYKEMT
jgi:hypothetical protein